MRDDRPQASDDEVLKRVTARACDAADAARRAGRSITATSRASRRAAATRMRGRTCSRRRSRSTTTDKLLGTQLDHGAGRTSTASIRSIATIAELARCAAHTRRCAAAGRWSRYSQDKPGLFAVSRFDPATGREIADRVQHFAPAARDRTWRSRRGSRRFNALHGRCAARRPRPGAYRVALRAARLRRVRRQMTSLKMSLQPTRIGDAAATPAARGGAARRSTRSIRAASPIRTATASATCRASPRSSIMSRSLGVDAIWLSPFFTSPMKRFRLRRRRLLRRRSAASARSPISTRWSSARTRSGSR